MSRTTNEPHLYHVGKNENMRRFIATILPIPGPVEREILDELDEAFEERDEHEVAERFIRQHEYLRRA